MMFTAYTQNEDKSINVLAGSGSKATLKRIVKVKGYSITDKTPFFFSGKYYLSEEDVTDDEKRKKEIEEQLAELDAQYEADKQEILTYYTEAMFAGDTDMQNDLKAEMQEIEAEYIKKREELEGAE